MSFFFFFCEKTIERERQKKHSISLNNSYATSLYVRKRNLSLLLTDNNWQIWSLFINRRNDLSFNIRFRNNWKSKKFECILGYWPGRQKKAAFVSIKQTMNGYEAHMFLITPKKERREGLSSGFLIAKNRKVKITTKAHLPGLCWELLHTHEKLFLHVFWKLYLVWENNRLAHLII